MTEKYVQGAWLLGLSLGEGLTVYSAVYSAEAGLAVCLAVCSAVCSVEAGLTVYSAVCLAEAGLALNRLWQCLPRRRLLLPPPHKRQGLAQWSVPEGFA